MIKNKYYSRQWEFKLLNMNFFRFFFKETGERVRIIQCLNKVLCGVSTFLAFRVFELSRIICVLDDFEYNLKNPCEIKDVLLVLALVTINLGFCKIPNQVFLGAATGGVLLKKGAIRNSAKIHRKTPVPRLADILQKGILWNYSRFTGKKMCCSLFPAIVLKRGSHTGVFLWMF